MLKKEKNAHQKAKKQILQIIKKSRIDYPSKSHIIGNYIGYSPYQTRAMVKELRNEGHAIAMNRNGYYWVTKKSDMEPTVINIQKRLDTIIQTVSSINRIIKKLK